MSNVNRMNNFNRLKRLLCFFHFPVAFLWLLFASLIAFFLDRLSGRYWFFITLLLLKVLVPLLRFLRILVTKLCDSLEPGYKDLRRIFFWGCCWKIFFVELGNIDLQLLLSFLYIMCINWIFLADFFWGVSARRKWFGALLWRYSLVLVRFITQIFPHVNLNDWRSRSLCH